MATSPYFNNYHSSREQEMLDNMAVEAIQMYGEDMYYIPRTLNNYNEVYGEDDQSSYEGAYLIDMYVKSFNGFMGDGDFYSKFAGVEVRDRVVLTCARTTFAKEVSAYTDRQRPAEGDLIYFPLNKKVFKIIYVPKYEMFYQLGELQTWEVTCELFDYSGETFDTGIPDIDKISNASTNTYDWAITDEDGVILMDEDSNVILLEGSTTSDLIIGDNSLEIENESADFIDFSIEDPFSEGNIAGGNI